MFVNEDRVECPGNYVGTLLLYYEIAFRLNLRCRQIHLLVKDSLEVLAMSLACIDSHLAL